MLYLFMNVFMLITFSFTLTHTNFFLYQGFYHNQKVTVSLAICVTQDNLFPQALVGAEGLKELQGEEVSAKLIFKVVKSILLL